MRMTVMIDGQSYEVEVEDTHARPVIAIVEGERFEVWPETDDAGHSTPDSTSTPEISVLETEPAAMAESRDAGAGSADIVAPLPGVIAAILVEPGDKVTHGQELCTLEAMKMKNAIRANREGTISALTVSVGDQVSHGQVLLRFIE